MLMLCPERDLDRRTLVPVKTLAVDDAEPFAFQNMHGFFAMAMLASMPTDRNFCLEHVAAHCGKAKFVSHH